MCETAYFREVSVAPKESGGKSGCKGNLSDPSGRSYGWISQEKRVTEQSWAEGKKKGKRGGLTFYWEEL